MHVLTITIQIQVLFLPLQGYPGKFYCPRMATMNKPAYAAIQTHSPTKPVRYQQSRKGF